MSEKVDEIAEWECAQCGGPAGTDQSKPTVGLTCYHCARRLKRWLTDIPDLYAQLDARPGASGPPLVPAKRRKLSGSPALARLDVILLQDPRTTTSAYYGTYDTDDPEGTYRAGDPKPAREAEDQYDPEGDIPGKFISYATMLAEQVRLRGPNGEPWKPRTLNQAIETLTGPWWENLCYQTWIVDLYDDVRETWKLLRRTNGISAPRRLGHCQCGAPVYEPEPKRDPVIPNPNVALITCPKCGHQMNVQALINIAAAARVQGA